MTTGKNKEQFERWYDEIYGIPLCTYPNGEIDFYCLPFEMQLGVYLAYYKSTHQIHISFDLIDTISGCYGSIYKFEYKEKNIPNRLIHDYKPEYTDIPIQKKCYLSKRFYTFDEAHQQTFKKADELVNKQL